VLSAGGALCGLARDGFDVVVATAFAGSPAGDLSPLAEDHHQRLGLVGDVVGDRRREDNEAMATLGVVPVHGPFVDAVYRKSRCGSWTCRSWADVFDERRVDLGLVDELQAWSDALVSGKPPSVLLGPGGIGTHIDHLLTRLTCRAMATQGSLILREWSDLPYAIDAGVGDAFDGTFLPDDLWARKCTAMRAYRSQATYLARYDESDFRTERLRDWTSSSSDT
jgi:hypothetical protein